jgi:hypothetical protein
MLSSFVFESRLGGFLHAPQWAGIESSGFSMWITRERSMKPPTTELIEGGGISPCLILWSGTCHSWLTALNGDPGATQILTRYFGAQSRIASRLVNLWTMPTGKSSQFSSTGLMKHLRMGLVHSLHHILTTQTELWGFIKSSA